MCDRRTTAEIARLADRRPDPPRRPQRGGDISSDSDDAPAARGDLICDSMYLLPFSNRLPTNVATQPVPLPTPATRGAADTDACDADGAGESDGCGLLEQALQLLREVYAHVCTRHTGRIDWHAIAASLNEHRACAACAAGAAADGPAPQRKLPPPLCAAAVRRLWRAVAYSRTEEEVGDAPETSDSHRVARSALLARIGGAVASHAAGLERRRVRLEGSLNK